MHAYANCFTFLLWGVRHASVSCFDVYFCVVLDGHSGLSSTMVCICTTPCQGGLRFGTARLIRAEQAAPGGRSLRFQAVKGGRGGGQNKYAYWRPRRGKPNEAY